MSSGLTPLLTEIKADWPFCSDARRCISILALATLLVAPAHAQSPDPYLAAEALDRFGLLGWDATGARAYGMAGAYRAAGRDVLSLRYNPACLAMLRSQQLHLGFGNQQSKVTSVYFDSETEYESSRTFFESVAYAYPVPTYRGSLVLAFGVFRTLSNETDFLLQGTDTYSPVQTRDLLYYDGAGGLYSYEFGMGIELSPRTSFGFSFAVLDQTIESFTSFESDTLSNRRTGFIDEEIRLDVDGFDLRAGFLWRPMELLSVGVTAHKYLGFEWEGPGFLQEGTIEPDGTTVVEFEDEFRVLDKFTYPIVFGGGAAVHLLGFTVAADARYTPWSEAKIKGPEGGNSVPLEDALKDTWEFMLGGEFSHPGLPFRVRAGYAYLQHPHRFLKSDLALTGAEAEWDTDRQLLTAGAGLVIDRVVSFDASASYGLGERSVPFISDRTEQFEIRVSGSYLF